MTTEQLTGYEALVAARDAASCASNDADAATHRLAGYVNGAGHELEKLAGYLDSVGHPGGRRLRRIAELAADAQAKTLTAYDLATEALRLSEVRS